MGILVKRVQNAVPVKNEKCCCCPEHTGDVFKCHFCSHVVCMMCCWMHGADIIYSLLHAPENRSGLYIDNIVCPHCLRSIANKYDEKNKHEK